MKTLFIALALALLATTAAQARTVTLAWDYPSAELPNIGRFEIQRLDPVTTLWVPLAATAPATGNLAPLSLTIGNFPDADTNVRAIAVTRGNIPSLPSEVLNVGGVPPSPSGLRVTVTVTVEVPLRGADGG